LSKYTNDFRFNLIGRVYWGGGYIRSIDFQSAELIYNRFFISLKNEESIIFITLSLPIY